MAQKAIIYYRKSTDRDDLQTNSLEHQLNNARRTAERNDIEIIKEIGESKSAKTEFTRDGFNEMISLCKLKKADFIICDEPKRLSRNNLDTSRLIDLMDKKCLKGILCTSREYWSNNPRDKFLLHFDLSLSKMDNEDRAKDVRDKMVTCLKKWQWVGKAPIGYLNVETRKGHKDVIVNPKIAPFIKKAFTMRSQGYSYQRIRDYWFENSIWQQPWKKIWIEQMQRILANRFYIGVMEWGGMEFEGKYQPIISKELFYEAKEVKKKVVHIHSKQTYLFTGMLRNKEYIPFSGYTKKGHIYYHQGFNAKETINISEKKVLDKMSHLFADFWFPQKVKEVTEEMIFDIYEKATRKINEDADATKTQITKLKERKDVLLNAFLDGDIEKGDYKMKLSDIEKQIADLEKSLSKKPQITSKIMWLLKSHSELLSSLPTSYPLCSPTEKVDILKSLSCELFVTNKKELHIAESKLYKTLKNFIFHIWYSQGDSNPCFRRERAMS